MANVLCTQIGNPHKTQSGGYIKTDYAYRGITFSAEISIDWLSISPMTKVYLHVRFGLGRVVWGI